LMRTLAARLGEDVWKWELVGLLHDLDYDLVKGDARGHGVMAARILDGRMPEDGLYAIKAQDHRTGFTPQSLLDRSLRAADALAVFIEDQAIHHVEGKEALAVKLDGEALRKQWISDVIRTFCRETGIELVELLRLGLRPDDGEQ